MATVESWFNSLMAAIIGRIPRDDWPDGSEFWDGLKRSLVRHGATEPVARDALERVTESPPAFTHELVPKFIAALKASADAVGGKATGQTCSWPEAQAAAAGCPCCDGQGQFVVYRVGNPRIHTTCHCFCAAGRWLYRDRIKLLKAGQTLLTRESIADGFTWTPDRSEADRPS
jgi:hypothetical protein